MITVRHNRDNNWPLLVFCFCFFFLAPIYAQNHGRPDLRISSSIHAVVENYCADCHGGDVKKGDLDLESAVSAEIWENPQVWEKVVRRLRARQMPPADKKRPDESTYRTVLSQLENSLDTAWTRRPNPE